VAKRCRDAFDPRGTQTFVLEPTPRSEVGRLADGQAADRGNRLQPGCEVDDSANHHALALFGPRPQAYQRFAGVDADPYREAKCRIGCVQVLDGLQHAKRGKNRSLGIVLMGLWSPENCHDGVTDEFLDCPTKSLKLRTQSRLIGMQATADVLRIVAFGGCREADQITEQHRDHLALLGR